MFTLFFTSIHTVGVKIIIIFALVLKNIATGAGMRPGWECYIVSIFPLQCLIKKSGIYNVLMQLHPMFQA
jgi:hypothetical protein